MHKRKTISGFSENIFFFIAYFIFMLQQALSQTTIIGAYHKYFHLIVIIFLILNLIINNKQIDRNNIKKYLSIFIMILMSLIIFLLKENKDLSLIIFVLFIISGSSLEIEKFFSYDLKFRSILLILIIILSSLNIAPNIILYRPGSSISRQSFGFSHPNTLAIYLASIAIEFLYLVQNKFKYIYLLIPLTIITIIFFLTDSKSSIILVTLATIIIIVNKKRKIEIKRAHLKMILKNSFLIFFLISILSTYLYSAKNDIGLQINNLMSNRLYYQEKYLEKYNINIFGNNLSYRNTKKATKINKQPLILDNSYIYILLNYGIIIFVIFFTSIRRTISTLFSEKNYIAILFIVIYLLYGISERTLLNFYYSPLIILLSYAFNKQNSPKDVLKLEQ